MGVKSLVTGCAGFIGSHLVDKLIEQGHEVVGIDNLSRGRIENVNSEIDFYQYDITNFESIAPLFSGVDYVYHLAALARVRPSVKQPLIYHHSNVTGTLNVLESCRLNKVKKIIFSSSSSVFGDHDEAYTEDMEMNPKNPYALQKALAEQYMEMYGRIYDLNYTILRFFNVWGPRMIPGGAYATVMGIFQQQKREGKPLTIFGDGSQRRDFTHVYDTVNACISAMNRGDKDDFNVGRGNNKSVIEIADMIGDEKVFLPPIPTEARVTLCDNTKARNILGWSPIIDVTEERLLSLEGN